MKTFLQRGIFVIGLLACFLGFGFGFSTRAATFTVNTTADNGTGGCTQSECTLREAIAQANSQAGDDIIEFDQTVFNTAQIITLAGFPLTITANGTLTINGTSATRLSISGDDASRVFSVTTNANLTLNGVTVTGGRAVAVTGSISGGGIFNNNGTINLTNSTVSGNSVIASAGTARGGGITNVNGGTINLTNSTVSGNSVSGVNGNGGGGIDNSSGTINLTNSTVSGNSVSSVQQGVGGGITNFGTLNLINSTVSGNSLSSSNNGLILGGGIYNQSGTLNITNGTVSGNIAGGSGNFHGGGIYIQSGTVNARNTILSGNTASTNPDLSGSLSAGSQNNLIGNFSSVRLAPLGFYGGATLTHALLSGSSAINAGNNCVLDQSCAGFNASSALTADQRGASRVGQVDIGAFELNNSVNSGSYRATLPVGYNYSNYNYVIAPNNGSFNYMVSDGSLPIGLNLTTNFAPNAVVAVSGTPTQTGTFNFSITASDGTNSVVTDYTLQILAPTAATVSVSGRVSAGKRGLSKARVYLTNQNGETRTVLTNSFGYYRFDDVGAGETYVFNVFSKSYVFNPQIITVNEEMFGIDFTAEP